MQISSTQSHTHYKSLAVAAAHLVRRLSTGREQGPHQTLEVVRAAVEMGVACVRKKNIYEKCAVKKI